MIQLTDKHWAFALPEGAHHVGVRGRVLYCCLPGMSVPITGSRFQLPPGSWQFLFTTKEATEEDARKVVECRANAYRDYEREFNFMPMSVFTAVESLQSLLKAKGCDVLRNWAIIQRL